MQFVKSFFMDNVPNPVCRHRMVQGGERRMIIWLMMALTAGGLVFAGVIFWALREPAERVLCLPVRENTVSDIPHCGYGADCQKTAQHAISA